MSEPLGGEPPLNSRKLWPGALVGEGGSVAGAVSAAIKRYRDQPLATAPGALLLSAWSNPTHMSDEAFRATPGAAAVRRSGFTSVRWVDTDAPEPVREIEL